MSALESVLRWGGVIEHPAGSHAWAAFGLLAPPHGGGWVSAGMHDPGWTCQVDQRHYGHRARKPTWLYASGLGDLPILTWGNGEPGLRIDAGFHSAAERAAASLEERQRRDCGRLPKRERAATPIQFRDLLISMARSVGQARAAAR